MKIKYASINLRDKKLELIEKANEIIAEYQAKGFDLTLRQLYYQFVSRDLLPNNDKSYKNLGTVISDGRMAGLIDWEAIVDRTRFIRESAHWKGPEDIVSACAQQFQLDKWASQPYYVEVFIEKDALIGVIEGVCNDLCVPYLACRGYASASEIWRAGHDRFRSRIYGTKRWDVERDGGLSRPRKCLILYLGDHDPSGIDMTRDIRERVNQFAGTKANTQIEVKRLALNMDQVEQYQPPPNPTKMTDSRAKWYVEEYGDTCWELDALSPEVIAELIRDAVLEVRDENAWSEAVDAENDAKSHLSLAAKHWHAVVAHVEDLELEE